MSAIEFPERLCEGAAGRRLRFLSTLVEERRDASDEEFAWYFGPRTPRSERLALDKALRRAVFDRPVERVIGADWGGNGDRLSSVLFQLEGGDRLAIVAREAHGASFTSLQRVPSNVDVRPAVESDAPALRELERRTPLVIGEASVSYDKGEDYFVGDRLMGDVDSLVLTVDGRPAGLFMQIVHPVAIGGQERQLVYLHRLRIDPAMQGKGLHAIINFYSMATAPEQGGTPYGFIASENRRMLDTVSSDALWSSFAERIVIDARENAGPPYGHALDPDRLEDVAHLLNDCHEREQFFRPYSVESLEARLSRVPAAYSADHLRVTDTSVLGVWCCDWEVSRKIGDDVTVDRRALVLDYGLRRGAEGDFRRLLASVCRELAESSYTELSMFTSPGSRGHTMLHDLAKRVEPYRIRTPIPEPPLASRDGVYVDQLYF